MNTDRKSRRMTVWFVGALASALASVACGPIEPIDYAFDPNAPTQSSPAASPLVEAAPVPEAPPSAAPDAGSATEQAAASRAPSTSAAQLAEWARLFEDPPSP